MKILMIIDRYFPMWGGAENQLKQLIPHLKSSGVHVTIATRRWKKNMAPIAVIDDTPVYRVGFPGKNILSTISYVLGLFWYALRKRHSIDIIHSHGAAQLGAVGSLIARILYKKNIAKVASTSRIPKLGKNILGTIILKIFKQSDVILCVNDEISCELNKIDTPDNRIVRITNAVDPNRFHQASDKQKEKWKAKRNFKLTDPIIVFSGRLVPVKGVDVLLNAWPAVVSSFPNARLIILGDGKNQVDSIEKKLIDKIRQEKIPNVYSEGEVPAPEHYLGVADILVCPSKREGFPNVLLEAMASGLATVASDIAVTQKLLADETLGLLFPTGDSDALAKKIIYLIEHPETRKEMGAKARKYVLENYAFGRIARQYFDIYKSLS